MRLSLKRDFPSMSSKHNIYFSKLHLGDRCLKQILFEPTDVWIINEHYITQK